MHIWNMTHAVITRNILMYRENETPYAIINILIIIIYINWISSLDKIGPDMNHTLGYTVGWGCVALAPADTEEHTTVWTEAVCQLLLTVCDTTADGLPKCRDRSMSVSTVSGGSPFASEKRLCWRSTPPCACDRSSTVVSEVHVVLVYLTLHVQVSVHLSEDLDHV